jgi:hypothetical protein
MTKNYSRDGGFLALLSPRSLVLQILSFDIRRVEVDEIEKMEDCGRSKESMRRLPRGAGGEKDNPTRMDKDNDG